MKIKILVTLLCSLLLATSAFCEELTMEKKQAIKELLEATGAYQIGAIFGDAATQQIVGVLKQAKPDIDPHVFDIIKQEVDSVLYEELTVNESLLPYLYPIYHKHLTLEETKGLVAFYTSPLGMKAVTVLPQMTQESMVAGREWGASLSKKLEARIIKRLEDEGIRLD